MRVKRALEFLRITDEDGNLSLTHAALVFVCVCIWKGIHVDLSEFGAFALTLGAYSAKKYIGKPGDAKPTVDIAPLEAKVKELSTHVAGILNQPALARFGLTPKKP